MTAPPGLIMLSSLSDMMKVALLKNVPILLFHLLRQNAQPRNGGTLALKKSLLRADWKSKKLRIKFPSGLSRTPGESNMATKASSG